MNLQLLNPCPQKVSTFEKINFFIRNHIHNTQLRIISTTTHNTMNPTRALGCSGCMITVTRNSTKKVVHSFILILLPKRTQITRQLRAKHWHSRTANRRKFCSRGLITKLSASQKDLKVDILQTATSVSNGDEAFEDAANVVRQVNQWRDNYILVDRPRVPSSSKPTVSV